MTATTDSSVFDSVAEAAAEIGVPRETLTEIYAALTKQHQGKIEPALEQLCEEVETLAAQGDNLHSYLWEKWGVEVPVAAGRDTETGEVTDMLLVLSETMTREQFMAYLRQEGLLPPKMKGFEGVVDEATFNWFIGLIASMRIKQKAIQAQADAMKKEVEREIKALKFHFGIGAKAYAMDQLPKDKNGRPKKGKKSFRTLHGTFKFEKTGGWRRDMTKEGKAAFEASLAALNEKDRDALGVKTKQVVEYEYDSNKLLESVKDKNPYKLGGYTHKGDEDEYGYWDIEVEKGDDDATEGGAQ